MCHCGVQQKSPLDPEELITRSQIRRSESSSSFGSSSSERDTSVSHADEDLVSFMSLDKTLEGEQAVVGGGGGQQEEMATQEEMEVTWDSTLERRRVVSPQMSLPVKNGGGEEDGPGRSSASPMYAINLSSPDSMSSISLSSMLSLNRSPEPPVPLSIPETPSSSASKPALPPKPKSPYIESLLAQRRKVRNPSLKVLVAGSWARLSHAHINNCIFWGIFCLGKYIFITHAVALCGDKH